MQKIRVLFSKKGTAKYISHLDMVRVVTRAIKRAQLPIVYSQGFNPTPRLSFALPMSLGHESEYEIMNFRLDPDLSCDIIKERLSVQLPDGFVIKEVYEAERDGKELVYSRYLITIDGNITKDQIEVALGKEEMIVIKKTKSGEKSTDIKPFIAICNVSSERDKTVIDCVLNAKDPNFLNPEYIVKYLSEYFGEKLEKYSVLRTCVYDEKMNIFR